PARGGYDSQPVEGVLELDRSSGDGRVYAGARRVDLSHWAPWLGLRGVAAEAGNGRAEAWARLDGLRVAEVTAQGELAAVVLRGTPLGPGAPAPRMRLQKVDALARWQQVDGGWRVDAPRLQLTTDDGASRLDGLRLAGGTRYGLTAEQLDIAPLAAVPSLSHRVPAGAPAGVAARRRGCRRAWRPIARGRADQRIRVRAGRRPSRHAGTRRAVRGRCRRVPVRARPGIVLGVRLAERLRPRPCGNARR